ncbi:DNA adenine methylase [Companilactobacillus ginsenosidimutans]|uniref:site-specific DNA-methyltransferase (adenine-specific) n=1 Tax=Companilactobacillus ginsenosidimutans TaxID=1007676 RepID=A0A0H4QNR0_9LACO|nr:DNA adenine methylase [Companilactobacillus ginsenosidimutans]AKP68398.1 hypothetical protein ABM34_04390 [Companilactobacillus ginsenosidimutans]
MKNIDRWKRGLPYTGNKSQVAEKIMNILPNGKRFVDVFGGGGSMSLHAASSNKYDLVLYNDRRKYVVELLKDLLLGDSKLNFLDYVYITRDDFLDWRDNKPISVERTLILICYSFGNNMHDYLWSEKNEAEKLQATKALFFGNSGTFLDNIYAEAKELSTIQEKYAYFHKWIRHHKDSLKHNNQLEQLKQLERLQRLQHLAQLKQLERLQRLQHLAQLKQLERLQRLQHLARLQQLEQLQRLQQLERIEYSSCDYHELNIKPDDIVYCDPPYINTKQSYGEFNNDDFDNWLNQLPTNQIYISEYTVLPNTEIACELGKKQNFISTPGNSRKTELLLKYIHH